MRIVTLLIQSELIGAFEEYRSSRNDHPHAIWHHEIRYGEPEAMKASDFEQCSVLEAIETPDFKPTGILAELADAVIRIAQHCGSDEVDMEAIVAGIALTTLTFTDDFEEMLAVAMLDASMAYAVTTPGGEHVARRGELPIDSNYYFACIWMGIFEFCRKNEFDLWSAIELKERYASAQAR